MRYLLIDRILRVHYKRELLALKNVALAEDIYSDHFFGFPVMPGALLIESGAQAGTALLEISTSLKKKALLAMVNRAKFRSMVHPGDQLSIVAKVVSWGEEYAQIDVDVSTGERRIMDARLIFAMEDSETFYPRKARFLIETIYQVWLRDAEFIDFNQTSGQPIPWLDAS